MSLLRNDGFIPGIKPLSNKKPSVISILDVGTSKICCIIASLHPRDHSQVLPGRTHKVEVIGIGHQRSRGIKSGVVVNLDQAEQAIRKCVDAAERMANLTVESLIVNVSSGRLVSEAFSANVDVGGHEISQKDIGRVLRAGAEEQEPALALLAGLDGDLRTRLEALEARIVKETLVRHRWNKTRAAKILGVTFPTIQKKIQDYGLG